LFPTIYNAAIYFLNDFMGIPVLHVCQFFKKSNFRICYTFILMHRVFLYVAGLMGIAFSPLAISPVSMEQARQYRSDPCLTPEEDQSRKQSIIDQFCTELKTYSGADFFSIIHAFLKDAIDAKEESFQIIDASSTFLTGKSQDKVFLLYDQEEHLKYAVKIFRNPRLQISKFLPEISALDLIAQLQLPHVNPIEPLAAALCECAGDSYGVLLETAATGLRVDQYVYAIANQSDGSKERKMVLKSAERAFWRMGESLAHLHSIHTEDVHPLPCAIMEKMDAKIRDVQANAFIVSSLSDYVLLDTFRTYLDLVKEQVKPIRISLTYQHGDSHLGNMFYDESQDKFYFIDNALLYKSVDIQGNPLLDGSSDVIRADEHFRRKAFGFLKQQETEHLVSIFYWGYQNVSGTLPDARLTAFYRAYHKLGRLLSYCEYPQEPDPQKRARDEAIFTQALEYFADQCNQLAKFAHRL
jgi:hypothetical protein